MPSAVLIGMAVCQMMDVWLGGERGCLLVSVTELMTAICLFHWLSTVCWHTLAFSVAFHYVGTYELLLHVQCRILKAQTSQ